MLDKKKYNPDLCTGADKNVFSVIESLSKNQRQDLKETIDERVSLVVEGESDDAAVDAFLLAAHVKRLATIDYQLLVEATGEVRPDEIDNYLANYGIGEQQPLLVTTFANADYFNKEDIKDD